jgi:uncharacterized protein
MPTDVGAVDLMIGFPSATAKERFDFLKPQLRDDESTAMATPIAYMFKDNPGLIPENLDPVAITLGEMDRHGVAVGLVGLAGDITDRALAEHPDRFKASLEIDPNKISSAVRRIRRAHADYDIKAVTTFPAGCNPQVPVSDRRYYPIYQTCIDLDLPILVNAGIAGPRLPSACQDVMHFDQVCYDFPDLRIVMRHGAEPWEELAVKLMLKYPNLYYTTSAFAPKHYPRAIVDFMNKRGADKVLYSGYFPMGLSLDRIFADFEELPLRDEVWPQFLYGNAARLFGLDQGDA